MAQSIYTVRHERVAPQIRPAGIAGDYSQATVRDLCSTFNPDGRVTPDCIKVYHHRGGDVGCAHRHYGLAGDPEVDPSVRCGIVSDRKSGIDHCMRPAMYADKMTALIGNQREELYQSHRRKPLGRTPEAPYPVTTPIGGFGMPSHKSDTTKSIMNAFRDVDVLHPAGAQENRGYDWENLGVDPTQYCFGTTNKSVSATSSQRFSGATVLVPKIVKDYRSTAANDVGQVKSYGFDDPEEWDASKRGPVSRMNGTAATYFQYEAPTVKELISTWAEPAADSSDTTDDGKIRSQRQLSASRRIIAVPAVSTDHLLSTGTVSTTRDGRQIITLQRLDDEASVQQLVHPCHYVIQGVQSRYFAGGRDREDVRRLCHKCDFGLSDAQIDEVFAENAGGDGKCGIEQFKNAAFAKGYM